MHKTIQHKTKVDKDFARDVHNGLSSEAKYLSSKYFYDAAGDKLFQQIMHLPEYYLTRAEYEIFHDQSDAIVDRIQDLQSLQLIELGAGDGTKTKLLLHALSRQDIDFTYYPLDISAHALRLLTENILKDVKKVKIQPVHGDYFKAFPKLPGQRVAKLILFLGSTIGNFRHDDVHAFFYKLGNYMNKGDKLLLGFDLKKDPQLILDAYNDRQGVTREFNMNLLKRINRELGGNFDLTTFFHYPIYDPEAGAAKSYLVSNIAQDVFIEALNTSYHFKAYESIYTEISRKYDMETIQEYTTMYDLVLKDVFYDSRGYFADALFEKAV